MLGPFPSLAPLAGRGGIETAPSLEGWDDSDEEADYDDMDEWGDEDEHKDEDHDEDQDEDEDKDGVWRVMARLSNLGCEMAGDMEREEEEPVGLGEGRGRGEGLGRGSAALTPSSRDSGRPSSEPSCNMAVRGGTWR